MAYMEKVMKGLECCKKLSAEDPFSGCEDCPYNEVSVAVEDCREALSADALKLLKEQELTISEYKSIIEYWERKALNT